MAYVFVSPHIDDAVMSMGGLIISLCKQRKDVRIEYIFTISNWTNPKAISGQVYEKNEEVITALRKEEERLVSRMINYKYNFFDFHDADLRCGRADHEQDAMINSIRDALGKSISKEDDCFFPLGLGHPDHIVIREVGVAFLKEGYNVAFYEDLPYLPTGNYNYEDFFRFVSGKGLRAEYETIDFKLKSDALQLYASQVSREWLKDITNYAYCPKDHSYFERYWKPENVQIDP